MPKKQVNVEAGTIVFTFEDNTIETFDLSKAKDARRLAIHGASQKVGDSYAGAGEADDPVAYAKAAVKETIQQLYDGIWRANAGGDRGPNQIVRAIAEATGQTVEAVAELYEAANEDEKKALAKKPRVAALLAKWRAESAAKRAAKLAEIAEKDTSAIF